MNLKIDLFFLIILRVNSCLSHAMWANFDLFSYNIFFSIAPYKMKILSFTPLKRDNLQIKWGKQIKYYRGKSNLTHIGDGKHLLYLILIG
jgi:hypothetical protein